jgi:unsaturated rhamnogalacturonyl hydrolase
MKKCSMPEEISFRKKLSNYSFPESCIDGFALGNRVAMRILASGSGDLGWDWGAGLLGDALGEWDGSKGGRGVRHFLQSWAQRHAKLGTTLVDVGGWHWRVGAGTTLLRLEKWSPSASRRRWISEIGRHVVDSPRGPNGIWLTKPDRGEVWIDTLATACPFLARAGSVGFGDDWIELAVEQLCAHATLLQSERSGLWMHAWDVGRGAPMGRLWARGNGWAIHAMVEVLCLVDARRARQLAALLAKTCEALIAVQDPCGAWHTVLDQPNTYVETSGQALLVRGLAKAARLGLIPARMRREVYAAAQRGWVVVASHVSDSGEVTGVSLGTPAGTLKEYANRAVASWPVWGSASVLLAAHEIALANTR